MNEEDLVGGEAVADGASEQELVDRYLVPPDGAAALDAIAELGRARLGLSHLWDASEHRYARFRAAAFDAIANFRPEDGQGSAPFILKGLEDENGYVLVAAARAAANLDISAAKPRLRDLTHDENQYVRSAASLALGRLGDAEDLRLLADLVLHDQSFRVIERASRGLGQLGSRHTPTVELESVVGDLLDRAGALPTPAQWSATRGILMLLRYATLHSSVKDRLLAMLIADAGVRGEGSHPCAP